MRQADANDDFKFTWYILRSSGGAVLTREFGRGFDDVPQAGDYDADGKTDLAIFREETGEWWIRKSNSGQVITYKFGQNDDIPLADTGIAARFMF